MRIAVSHTDSDHPNNATFAFRLGRAQDGTDFVTGEDRSAQDTVNTLLELAKKEFPESDGYTHQVEHLAENGDTAEWVPADQSEPSTPASPGETQEVNLEAPVTVNIQESS